MQVLNIYGKIKNLTLSKSLGLCISNIPKSLKHRVIDAIKIEISFANFRHFDKDIDSVFKKCLSKKQNNENIDKKIEYLVDNMICIRSHDNGESYVHKKNVICNPIDQIEFGDKFLKFIGFWISLSHTGHYLPFKIYDDHLFYDNELIHIIDYFRSSVYLLKDGNNQKYIDDLLDIGKLIDHYIENEYDFEKLDYIINSLSYIHSEDYDLKHFMNSVNILVMLLVRPNNTGGLEDLDEKLQLFIDKPNEKLCVNYIRKIRNKVAHGNFKEVNKLLEE